MRVTDGIRQDRYTILRSIFRRPDAPFLDRTHSMPQQLRTVILPPGAFAEWLVPEPLPPERLEELLVPHPSEDMMAVQVGTRVNSPANDDEECLRPAGQQDLF